MSKLRVANIVTRLTAGTGVVALHGALALDPSDYEVTFIVGGDDVIGDGAGADVPLDTVWRDAEAVDRAPEHDMLGDAFKAGCPVAQVPALVREISPSKDRAGLRVLTQVLAEGDFDVVHTHSAKAGVLGRMAAHRAGMGRIVHTWHGFPWHRFMPLYKRNLYVTAERYVAKYTDAFLAVGNSIAIEAMQRGLGDATRVRAIDSLISPADYTGGNAARAQARSRLDLPLGVRVMGVVARIASQKAPDVFLKALAKLPAEVHGVWVGDGPDRAEMEALAHKLGLAGRMHWLGYRDDVAQILPAFDVFALSSIYEGLPCVLAEAMMVDVPVVATAVDGVPDLVAPGRTGLLVPPRQPEAFAEAVRFVLDNPREAERLAVAARESLGDRFVPATLARVLDDTYRGASVRPAVG